MSDQTTPTRVSHLWPYLCAASAMITTYFIYAIIYNLYFHPLRSFPGPLFHRATPMPYILHLVSGQSSFHTHRLHEKYGSVVRIGPNHLSFTDVRAWRDIYGHRVPPATTNPNDPEPANPLDENPKSPLHYGFLPDVPPSILEAPRAEHAMLRKAMSNGFSEKALRSQESRIQRYVDFLVLRLRQNSKEGERRLDLAKWYNWIAFDIVGDLVFAEPFGCLERQEYHPYVELIVGTLKGGTVLVALNYLGMQWVMRVMWDLGVGKLVGKMRDMLKGKLEGRMTNKVEVEDLFEGLMKVWEKGGIDLERLQSNASVFIAAGSETTATLLSGVTYLLLSNPEAMAKLKIEIRNAFNSADEITIASASRLPYMLACLNEALRMYPPVTGSIVRQIAPGGATIAGHILPGGALAECQQWAMHHSSAHWQHPWSFKPERFLHDKAGLMKVDVLEAFQPFSTGPRNCIGRNLAYAEMRLILANMIYNFDLTLADESKGWIEKQRAYPLWARGPLHVLVEPAFD